MFSIWEKQSFLADADVMIIGGGFTGLWTSYFLKKNHPARSVTLVDRGYMPSGASTRNAGFACFGSASELIRDSAEMGEDEMLGVTEMRFKGIRRIQDMFPSQVDFDSCGGYDLISSSLLNSAGKTLDTSTFREQVNRLNKQLAPIVKENNCFRFADQLIGSFGFAGIRHLVYTPLEGALHPGKLCQSLLRLVQGMGVTTLYGIQVDQLDEHSGMVRLSNRDGFELSAKRVLICTNGFADHLLPDTAIRPARGQILVTSPIDDLPFTGTFHYDEGYYYFRNLGNRVLLGGARNLAVEAETTTEEGTTAFIQKALETFLAEIVLPRTTYTITDRWSGIMGLNAQKIPVVRKISANITCAIGMNGMGVALAPIVGEQAAKLTLE